MTILVVSTSGSSGRRLHLRHIHIYSILYVSLCTCDMYPEINCAWPPLVFAAKHQNSQINGGMKHHSIFQRYSELMCQIEDPRGNSRGSLKSEQNTFLLDAIPRCSVATIDSNQKGCRETCAKSYCGGC